MRNDEEISLGPGGFQVSDSGGGVDGDAIHCLGGTGQGSLVDKVGYNYSQFGPSGFRVSVGHTSAVDIQVES